MGNSVKYEDLSMSEVVDYLYFNITDDEITVTSLMKCFDVGKQDILDAIANNVLNNVP